MINSSLLPSHTYLPPPDQLHTASLPSSPPIPHPPSQLPQVQHHTSLIPLQPARSLRFRPPPVIILDGNVLLSVCTILLVQSLSQLSPVPLSSPPATPATPPSLADLPPPPSLHPLLLPLLTFYPPMRASCQLSVRKRTVGAMMASVVAIDISNLVSYRS